MRGALQRSRFESSLGVLGSAVLARLHQFSVCYTTEQAQTVEMGACASTENKTI